MDITRNMTISRRKADLRGKLIRRLDAVDAARQRRSSAELREQVVRLPEIARAKGVLACLSFGSEIDTWGLVEQLRQQGKAIFVPRSSRRDGQLHVRHGSFHQLPRLTLSVPPRSSRASVPARPHGRQASVGDGF